MVVEVNQEIPRLLSDPRAGRVAGTAEDVDASGGVLDDGKAVSPGTVQQVDGEEVGMSASA